MVEDRIIGFSPYEQRCLSGLPRALPSSAVWGRNGDQGGQFIEGSDFGRGAAPSFAMDTRLGFRACDVALLYQPVRKGHCPIHCSVSLGFLSTEEVLVWREKSLQLSKFISCRAHWRDMVSKYEWELTCGVDLGPWKGFTVLSSHSKLVGLVKNL